MSAKQISELQRRIKEILCPLKKWYHQCHGASITLVRNGIGTRVARGLCDGVGGQHSWVVVGDCYKPELIIDPTLWSYRADVKGVFIGNPITYRHAPHGSGSIWAWGRPVPGNGPVIKLTPKKPLSAFAREFLSMIEPLDREGWARLSSAPVEGWPAGEIFAAMDDTKELTALVPIDKIGMLTDRNPGGLYLPQNRPTIDLPVSPKPDSGARDSHRACKRSKQVSHGTPRPGKWRGMMAEMDTWTRTMACVKGKHGDCPDPEDCLCSCHDKTEPRCPWCGETKANHGDYASGEDWVCPTDTKGAKLNDEHDNANR